MSASYLNPKQLSLHKSKELLYQYRFLTRGLPAMNLGKHGASKISTLLVPRARS